MRLKKFFFLFSFVVVVDFRRHTSRCVSSISIQHVFIKLVCKVRSIQVAKDDSHRVSGKYIYKSSYQGRKIKIMFVLVVCGMGWLMLTFNRSQNSSMPATNVKKLSMIAKALEYFFLFSFFSFCQRKVEISCLNAAHNNL